LDEGMIPWRGCLKFGAYNPRKITKYQVFMRMVCGAKSQYTYSICNMEIYIVEKYVVKHDSVNSEK
jgi:hypothetical protein